MTTHIATGATPPPSPDASSSKRSGNEFWRDIKPIADFAKPGSRPEVYVHDCATEDMRYYVPFSETVFTRPIYIDINQNR